MLIGICGRSGSGKTFLANKIVELFPALHLNIDNIGHDIINLESVKKALVQEFSDRLLTNNVVDRQKLGMIVFKDNHAMLRLTEITWHGMEKEIDDRIAKSKEKIIILDWQLLPKTKFFAMCDLKILIENDYEIRKKRAMERDQITEDAFRLRDQAGYQYHPDDFDFVIQGNEEGFQKIINFLVSEVKK